MTETCFGMILVIYGILQYKQRLHRWFVGFAIFSEQSVRKEHWTLQTDVVLPYKIQLIRELQADDLPLQL